jgi:hypothetical protein
MEDEEATGLRSCRAELPEPCSGLVRDVSRPDSASLAAAAKLSVLALLLLAFDAVTVDAFSPATFFGHQDEGTMKSKGRQSRFRRLQFPQTGFFSSQLAWRALQVWLSFLESMSEIIVISRLVSLACMCRYV